MAYDARAVANYFIKAAKREGIDVSPMKLQKLLYFAHGWYLAVTDTPLLEERIEAWSYGPVIPDIYLEFKRFGNEPITSLATKPVRFGSPAAEPYRLPDEKEDRIVNEILHKVWETHKGVSAISLSNMTHQKDTPWSKTVEPYLVGDRFPANLVISDELIKDYFTKDEH